MSSVTVNGITYNTTDFENFGHSEIITAGTGEELPRLLALVADIMADASRARQATSATSKNAGLTGSQNWVLSSDISFGAGSYVTISRTSDPTGVFYIGQVTGYVSGTKTLTVNVTESTGAGGPYTDWTISLAAKPASASVLPITDSTAIVKGSSDPTKQLRIEVDGLSAGTRVWTPQDRDLTLAGLDDAAVGVRNRIINGTFAVAQRTMPTTDNSYALDRWRLLLEAANAATIAQDTADVPTGAKYACKITVGSGNNNKFGIWQPILGKNVYDLRGRTVSARIPLKATSGISDVRVGIAVFTGTEDAVSGDPVSSWGSAGTNPMLATNWSFANTPANLGVTASWGDFTLENVSIPSNATNIALMIWCDDKSTTQTTDILRVGGYVSLIAGQKVAPVTQRSYEQELADCLAYYEQLGGVNPFILGSGHCNATTSVQVVVHYTRKHKTPSLSASGSSIARINSGAATNVASTGISPTGASVTTANLDITGASGLTAGNGAYAYLSNTGDYIAVDAEI